MALITRRTLLTGAAAFGTATLGLGTYAVAIEQGIRLGVTSYALTPPGWPADLRLTIAVVADLHACEPWMPASRVRQIVDLTNALNPDVTVILGDFTAGHHFVTGPVRPDQWGAAVSYLRAPLGVYSILGNHDWWHGPLLATKSDEGESVRRALRQAGITVLENDAVRLARDGRPFWLIGLGDQLAHVLGRGRMRGVDDLDGTLAKIGDEAPVVLLAHEPYIFPRVPARVSLTLCGHTHGGQVNIPLLAPLVAPGHRLSRYIYGHIEEGGRHMIISAGLGTSIAPIRFMRPPEVLEITLGGPAIA